MDYQQQYQKKKGPWEGALSLVRSNDTILAAMYGCEPVHFLQNLHTIADRVDHVTLWSMMVMGHYPVKYDTSLKGKIDIISYFYNDACRKGHDGAFAYGDRSLYQNMKESPGLQMRRARYVNDPFVIAQNDNMVSVNAAIEIDLTGQVSSESIGLRQFTGTGGATDFAYGAFHSKGGRGIIALPSTAKAGTISKISPILTPGAIVTISRNLTDYIVTEYGIARMRNRSVRQRVENLIAVAHPDFRAELRKEANKMMIW